MQFVGRVISSVSDLYGSINPSNLSGAIDVLVVEDKQTGELRSSPFHVRFGKGQVLLRPQDRKVDVIVNGKKVPGVEMRIGEAGEAYFVELLEDGEAKDVPERFLSTSPNDLAVSGSLKALSDNELSKEAGDASPKSTGSTGHLSDSEVTYSPVIPSGVVTTTVERSPDWNWQWGDLPVHKSHESVQESVQENVLPSDLDDVHQSATYMDIIAYLQTARNIERVSRHIITNEGLSVKLWQVSSPFRVYSVKELRVHFDRILQENVERELIYESFSEDLMKLLDNALLSKLVIEFTLEDGQSYYLAGKAALHTSIAVSLFGEAPSLATLLKLGEEPLEEELPALSVPLRSWRSWWSRSPASPLINTVPPSSPTLSNPTSPIPVPTALAPESPVKESAVRKPKYLKSLRLSSEKLKLLNLGYGENSVLFSVGEGEKAAYCASKIYLWTSEVKIVISDIDGTITKSDALGHFFAMVGKDWTHSGVASLYDAISKNGYKFLYLTSRSIGQSSSTQRYIRSLEQDKNRLPDGPIIMSPERLFAALKREVIVGNPEEFKIAALKDVQRLFYPEEHPTPFLAPFLTPFYAGFGNRITDARSYHAVGVPPSRIFTVNGHGAVWVEQLVLVGGASSSYLAMADIVDLYFPPVESAPKAEDENFSELTFWRAQRQDLNLLVPALKQMTAVVGVGDNLILIEGGDEGSISAADSQYGEEEEEDESVSPFPYI